MSKLKGPDSGPESIRYLREAAGAAAAESRPALASVLSKVWVAEQEDRLEELALYLRPFMEEGRAGARKATVERF